MRIFVLLVAMILVGCTDAELGSLTALGDSATVECYSGGQKVFTDQSTGKVELLRGGGGWHYRSTNGQYVRTFADCFVFVK